MTIKKGFFYHILIIKDFYVKKIVKYIIYSISI